MASHPQQSDPCTTPIDTRVLRLIPTFPALNPSLRADPRRCPAPCAHLQDQCPSLPEPIHGPELTACVACDTAGQSQPCSNHQDGSLHDAHALHTHTRRPSRSTAYPYRDPTRTNTAIHAPHTNTKTPKHTQRTCMRTRAQNRNTRPQTCAHAVALHMYKHTHTHTPGTRHTHIHTTHGTLTHTAHT